MSKCAQKSWMSCANGGGMRKFFGGKNPGSIFYVSGTKKKDGSIIKLAL